MAPTSPGLGWPAPCTDLHHVRPRAREMNASSRCRVASPWWISSPTCHDDHDETGGVELDEGSENLGNTNIITVKLGDIFRAIVIILILIPVILQYQLGPILYNCITGWWLGTFALCFHI